ncbi:MAG: efflux RND transporter periplasmic adaptor subunit [Porticoccaceae bacterium]
MQSRWQRASARFKGYPKTSAAMLLIAVAAILWAGSRLLAPDDEPEFQTMVVARGDIEDSIGSLGTLEPKDYVDVGTQVSGQLERLHVDIGDQVEKGQLLAEIDPAVYESRVRGSRATLDNLRAQLALQESEQELAKRRLQRNRNLYAERAVSEDVLLASETEVQSNASRIQALKAQIDAAEATLDGDVANLGYTKIYAPMSGTVVDSLAIQGQTINASQTAPTIVRIANLDVMTVRAQVSEADVVRIDEGMAVYFTTLGMPERRWRATVRKVLPTPVVLNNVVLFNVLIDVDNSDRALMTSMTAQVFFLLAEARGVLVAPAEAVSRSRDDSGKPAHRVQVITAHGPEWRPVRVGVRSRTEVEILSGLDEGQEIVSGRSSVAAPGAQSRSVFSVGGPGRGPR